MCEIVNVGLYILSVFLGAIDSDLEIKASDIVTNYVNSYPNPCDQPLRSFRLSSCSAPSSLLPDLNLHWTTPLIGCSACEYMPRA